MRTHKLIIFSIVILFASASICGCQKDYKKRDKAIQKIESNIASNHYRAARKAIGKIPGQYTKCILEYTNKVNKAELTELISKGKTEKAKELFVQSCTNQDFFADNAATAVGLVDDEFIVSQLSGWKLVDPHGDPVAFSEKAIKACPDASGWHTEGDNYYYNEVVKKYNNAIESVVYSAILSNKLELAEKCMMLYMPLAKEVSRTKQKGYSYDEFDVVYEKDNHYLEEAEESIASVQQIKSIEKKFNNTQFARGSAELSTDAKSILDELAALMLLDKTMQLKIVGHTSADGRKSKNLNLSKDRAQSVANYLIEKGVPFSRLETDGMGSSDLKDKDNPNSEVNCRTEFLLRK